MAIEPGFRRLAAGPLLTAIALCLAGTLVAHADEPLVPQLASKADMACASITGYALAQSEDKILPLLKLCGENPNRNVCDITVSLMKDLRGGRGGTYGLTCAGIN